MMMNKNNKKLSRTFKCFECPIDCKLVVSGDKNILENITPVYCPFSVMKSEEGKLRWEEWKNVE